MRNTALLLLLLSPTAWAEDAITLVEKSPVGSEFRVVSEFSFKGELLTPIAKDKPAQRVKTAGRSSIDYVERVLSVDPKDAEFKALRIYEKIDFRKTTEDRTDEITLRPAVRRLVVMKKGHAKVPFSPDGPLMWGEIDMLRTDFVVPALTGLLPTKEVKPGDTWMASAAAVAELTDFEKVEEGRLECTLDRVRVNGPRRLAEIAFAGTLRGVNEDGPARQLIRGKLLFDLTAQCISYLKIDGEHILLDDKGNPGGKVVGTFQMTRSPAAGNKELAAALKSLDLTPSDANTRLLYDGEDTGVRFVYPRHWRVVRTTGRQITLDETTGTGLLITLDAPKDVPATNAFMRQTLEEMKERGAKLTGRTGPDALAEGIDRFTLDAETTKDRYTMDYVVIRQGKGGATLAARIPVADRAVRMREVEGIARSFSVTRRLDGK